jgi:hypothetical protein
MLPRVRGGRGIAVSLAAVAATGTVAGCGSTYTKADLITSADAVCTATVAQVRSIASRANAGGQGLTGLAAYLGQVVPVVRSEDKQLHALRRPKESAQDRQTFARFLTDEDRVAAGFAAWAAAAKSGGAKAATSAATALMKIRVTADARRYGLRVCGAPGATVIPPATHTVGIPGPVGGG